MAVPSYTTDLTTINDAQSGTWTEPTGGTLGTLALADTDNAIQNTASTTKATGNTGYPNTTGMGFQAATPQSITTPSCVYIWLYHGAPATMETLANGGYRVIVGQDSANFKHFYVLGSAAYAYGGWVCIAVDPSLSGDTTNTGTPSGTLQYFGSMVNQKVAISKGNPIANDAIRWGRTLQVVGGETSNYATFTGAAAKNDANDVTNGYNRWGQLQAIAGGYQLQGQLLLGTAGTAVDFRDANTSVLIANNLKVASGFNEIEIRNASSIVYWTSISFQSLGTVSRGNFIVTNNATVNLTGCSFTDMGTFGFLVASTLLNVTFRRCQLVTQASAVITNCRFEDATGAVALLSNNPAAITGSTFVSDGTGHAIEITTAGEYALSNCTFTGYAATGTPGTSGNEVIYNNSSGNVIINASGCVGTITYKNGTSATTTVNQTITLTLTGLVTGSDIVILDAGTTTERVNVDSNAGTTYGYGYADSGSSIDVGVFKAGYVPFYIRAYTLAATAASLPVAQVLDRNYLV